MEKKASTPQREARRRYEERKKAERKAATCLFGTKMPVAEAEEINAFLKKYQVTKIEVIRVGYDAIKEMIENQKG